MTEQQLNNIERTCRMCYDFRNNSTNERKIVYEIKPFMEYILIHKQNGNLVSFYCAQNGLTLVLNHFN